MNRSSFSLRLPGLVSLLVGCGDVSPPLADQTTGDSAAQETTTIAEETSASNEPTTDGGKTTGGDAGPAVDDTYFATQDTALVVAAGAGVSANDGAAGSGALEVTAFDAMTSSGATVFVAADGGFTYTPKAGAWAGQSHQNLMDFDRLRRDLRGGWWL